MKLNRCWKCGAEYYATCECPLEETCTICGHAIPEPASAPYCGPTCGDVDIRDYQPVECEVGL